MTSLAAQFADARSGKESRHEPRDRITPSAWQYDWLLLSQLSADIQSLIPRASSADAIALDLGCGKSPYGTYLLEAGYTVRTLDITPESGPDYVGTVEQTGLLADSLDLVICTQVLEHCMEPWTAVHEITRILKPGGCAVVSVPHVWFYHPHPSDNWRFTQEGLLRLLASGGLLPDALLAQRGSVAALAQILNFLVYGIAGRAGAPIYWLTNQVGRAADAALPNPLFSLNFAARACKPPKP
jgi:SAM-dependent methyltransferase